MFYNPTVYAELLMYGNRSSSKTHFRNNRKHLYTYDRYKYTCH